MNPPGQTSTVKVYQNATLLGTYTNSDGARTNALNWKNFAVTFTATDPYTVIAFVNADGPNDWLCGIDDVVFAPVTSGAAARSSHLQGAGK